MSGETPAVLAAKAIHCPTCGYNCLGKGGAFCVDKPGVVRAAWDEVEIHLGTPAPEDKAKWAEGMLNSRVRTVPDALGAKPTKDPWKHRSKGMVCATCMWNVMKEQTQPVSRDNPITSEKPVLGRCRRHAPTMNGYPAVFPNDWCGDHKLDENKI